jgi:regulator of replication initiation timing
MRKLAMTPGAFPHRSTAAPFRVAMGLALAASAGIMLWGLGTHSVSFASEIDRSAAPETPMAIDDRVAALTEELAQVKAEMAKLGEGQSDTSVELSRIRANLANAEIGLDALRTTTDENEARQGDTAAQMASNLAQLKDETFHLRLAQDDTATEMGSLRAHVANSEIGVDWLRATTGEIRQQIQRIEAARDVTSSIAKSHKHHGHRKWVAQR